MKNLPRRRHPRPLRARRERGVAALVVVMILFFVVSLVAAYTNRNLIFEQRTSANVLRATQAFEAAQAGIDWAVAMLNGGRIDATCNTSGNVADTSFRQRYLDADLSTGVLTPRNKTAGGALSAACVFNGATWDCSCPVNADPTPPVPAGAGVFPAYRVRFVALAGAASPGIVRLDALACPRYDANCLDFANDGGAEGRARITVLVALSPSVKTTPGAALTARGDVSVAGSTISAHNADLASGAVAVQAGGVVAGVSTSGAPGAPPSAAVADGDTSLSGLTAAAPLLPNVEDRMFATVFGLAPADYRDQPAAFVIGSCPCSAATLRSAISVNPGRPIWVSGDLAIDSAGDIGSAGEPVALIVNGSLTSPTAATIFGVVYARTPTWTISGNATVRGGAIAESAFAGSGSSTFVYDTDVLKALRATSGSFVVVPGSWRDYP